MVPVRRSGAIALPSRAQPMGSADFARQLLYSAEYEDIQAVQLTALQGFSQTLPGDCRIHKSALSSQTEQGTCSLNWHWQHARQCRRTPLRKFHGMLRAHKLRVGVSVLFEMHLWLSEAQGPVQMMWCSPWERGLEQHKALQPQSRPQAWATHLGLP